jgi:hypothetical protein
MVAGIFGSGGMAGMPAAVEPVAGCPVAAVQPAIIRSVNARL